MPDGHTTQTEPDRVRSTPILATVFGFTLLAALCAVALLFYYNALVGPGLYVPPRQFPAPGLQTSPLEDLEKLQSAQAARIGRYGWIDQSNGLYRIPIERAMEIVASKGTAALEPLEQPPSPQQSAAELAGQAMQKAATPPAGGAP
jgi:hypothetical protein